MKFLKASGSYYGEFVTTRFDTGAATDADSTPTATATKNGADDGSFSLTCSKIDTGRYKVTGTVPAYSAGDVVQISVSATVNSVSAKGVVDEFVVASALPGIDAVPANATQWNSHSVLEAVNGSPVVTLGATQAAYAPAKAGDAMLITAGTSTGQLDVTSGVIKANLTQILGTVLTETSGYLAAGFKKLFNVATPVMDLTSVNQTGDSYAKLPTSPAAVGSKMDIVDSPSVTGLGVIVQAIWDKLLTGITTSGSIGKLLKDDIDTNIGSRSSHSVVDIWNALLTGIVTTGSIGKLIKDYLDAAISTRSTYAGGAVASVTAAVTVGTNNDKTGYSLSTAPPTKEDISTKVWSETTRSLTDKAGFALSQSFPANFASMIISALGKVTTGTNDDKSGYSLSTTPPTKEEIRAEIDTYSTKLDTTVGSRLAASGYTAPANANISTILTTINKLDAMLELHGALYRFTVDALSQGPSGGSGSAPTVGQIDTQLSSTHGSGAWGAASIGSTEYTDTVFDSNGDPVEDALVELYSDSDYETFVTSSRTNVNGVFSFSLDPGTYYVQIIGSGFDRGRFTKVVS
jgi:hypothetical protein